MTKRTLFSKSDLSAISNERKKEFSKVAACDACGLYKYCKSPKMKYTGRGRLRVLMVGEAPGKTEDARNEQFVGEAGDILRNQVEKNDLDLDEDFWKTNSVICRPMNASGSNRTPESKEILCCRANLFATINELKPRQIWLLGNSALEAFYGSELDGDLAINRFRGLFIPDRATNAWIVPLYHPSYPMRDEKNKNLWSLYERDMKNACKNVDKPFPVLFNPNDFIEIFQSPDDLDFILEYLEEVLREKSFFFFDYETTGVKPHRKGHKIAAMSCCSEDFNAISFPYDYNDFWHDNKLREIRNTWCAILENRKIKKMSHGMKFEDAWSRYILNANIRNWHWCSMTAAHILDNRTEFAGLKFQTYIQWGIRPYDKEIAPYLDSGKEEFNEVMKAPLIPLLKYSALDSLFGFRLSMLQQSILLSEQYVAQRNAFDFTMDGLEALCDVQQNGIPLDMNYYLQKESELRIDIKKIEKEIYSSDENKAFRKAFAKNVGITSSKDLGILFYKVLGQRDVRTEKGNYSLSEETLEDMNVPFAKNVLRLRKLQKNVGTYIAQFTRECVEDRMFPIFDLHIPVTYRGSCSKPNFQNIPVRDEESKQICRGGIIPSKGFKLLEADYSGIEVRISACYHKDPTMINYIMDPSTDMHRDCACDLWKLSIDEVTKDIRFYAKNGWTFAQFYGDWYKSCAQTLWKTTLNLKTKSGIEVREHIRKNGIRTYEQFEKHCQRVEDIFWNDRFRVYKRWREDINIFYQENGYIETHLGFRMSGYMKRNDVTNYQIQGTAFHCLLWSLIRLNEIAKREKWKTKIIGQIHDSILFDLCPEEEAHVMKTIYKVATQDIRKEFDWIIVPLDVEFELSDINKSWATKKEVKLCFA